MKVTKKHLTEKIQKRFGNEITQRLLKDATDSIIDTIITELTCDRPVSVENFGTLSPFIFHGHQGMDIATGKNVFVPAFRTVRFHPHDGLRALMERRKRRK